MSHLHFLVLSKLKAKSQPSFSKQYVFLPTYNSISFFNFMILQGIFHVWVSEFCSSHICVWSIETNRIRVCCYFFSFPVQPSSLFSASFLLSSVFFTVLLFQTAFIFSFHNINLCSSILVFFYILYISSVRSGIH